LQLPVPRPVPSSTPPRCIVASVGVAVFEVAKNPVMTAGPVLAGAMSLVAGIAVAEPRLDAFAATFEGRKPIALIDARAEAVATLRRSASHAIYTLTATIRWTVVSRAFEQCSVVRFEGDRVAAVAYAHIDRDEPRNDVRTDFDWAAGKAVTQLGNGEVRTIDIAWPAWDPMSFQLALMTAAPSKRVGDVETHAVVERGTLKVHRVVFEGPASSLLAGTSHTAIRSEKTGGGVVSLLLDPTRGFRPLRIGIEGVNLDFVAARAAPAALAADEVPSCPPLRRPR
jgi:hypothetical protein